MKIIERLKTDRRFLIKSVAFVVASLVIPYITIPTLILWWFFKTPRFSKLTKSVVSGVVIGLFVLLIIYASRLPNTPKTNSFKAEKQPEVAQTQKSTEQLQKEVNELQQTIKDKLKDVDITEAKSFAIEKMVRSSVGEKTNTNLEKIREVRVNTTYNNENEYTVFVAINGDELVTKESIRNSLFMDNSDIYLALYKDRQDIREVSIVSYVVTVDKYGNESDTVVLKTSLDSIEANKVNWNQDKAVLELGILPEVWTTQKDHLSVFN